VNLNDDLLDRNSEGGPREAETGRVPDYIMCPKTGNHAKGDWDLKGVPLSEFCLCAAGPWHYSPEVPKEEKQYLVLIANGKYVATAFWEDNEWAFDYCPVPVIAWAEVHMPEGR
jgi:hypothetical protein